MLLRNLSTFFVIMGCACLALAGSGCASVKTVADDGGPNRVKMRPPDQIFVGPFATTQGMWQGRASEPGARIEIRDWLSAQLERHLSTIAPTRPLGAEPPRAGWLVTGRFLRVNPGSRAGRFLLGGIGAGGSKLETRVEVFDLAVSAREPIFSFSTTGGSNLAGGVSGAMSTMEDDIERTAREIRDHLETYLWPADSAGGRPRTPAALPPVEVTPR